MRPGLTFKLSVLLACTGILASGLTGYYAYQANRRMLVSEAERSLLTSTELLSQRLSTAISNVAADTYVLADLQSPPKIVQLNSGLADEQAKDRMALAFSNFIRHHPEYLQIRLITRQRSGLDLVRVDRDGNRPVRVLDGNLREVGQFPYVSETLAMAPGGIYISPITVNHEPGARSAEGKPALLVAAPVVSESGAVVGVMVIDVDLTSLLKILQIDLPRDYQVYLANEWGNFVIRPDVSKAFGPDRGASALMQDSFVSTKALFEQTKSSVILNGMEQPQQAPGQVLAFIRKPFGMSAGKHFMVLGLSKPLADVLAGAKLLGDSIIRMILIFSVLAIVLAVLCARVVTQPLQILARAASHFFEETAMEALPLERADEIGILARCFDQMSREIKSRMDLLYNKQHELVHLASHDDLTKLPNRMLFLQKLESAIQDATVSGEQLAVLFIDLDRFKLINDQFGHSAGDSVLIAVAKRLQHVLRGGDLVARLGGDEFVVLIKGLKTADAATHIAAKIMRTLDDELLINNQLLTVAASIGISQFPIDGACAEALLLNADAAMYAAKADGRHTFMHFRDLADAQKLKAVLSKVAEMEDSKPFSV